MTVLIMAGGKQTHWKKDTLKQLTELPNGETVIGRIYRQLNEKNSGNNITLTDTDEIKDIIHLYPNQYWLFGVIGRWIVETLKNKVSLLPYADYTRILLGDTVYSAATMNAILTCDKPLAFFADQGEIYAFCFHRDRIPVILSACERIIQAAEGGEFHRHEPGKLWHLYRALAGHPLLEHRPNWHDGLLVEVTDWTTDLDTLEDWFWLRDNVLSMGLLDDVPVETITNNE